MDGYSPSLADISAVTRNNDGFGFGGEGLWLFAILALMGGGFGNWGNRGNGNCATTEDVASGFNFSALQNKTNEILSAVGGVNQNIGNAICNLGYQNARDFAGLSQQLSSCCCETQRNIDSVRFDMANYTAAINANTNAGVQKILDKMCEDKAAAQAQRIANLELQQALCGVVRYPTTATYATHNPFCGFNNYGCNNGCNNF